MILEECLSYYISNWTLSLYTFLDARKAPHRVKYSKLFSKLSSPSLPPIIIRMLLNMYVGHATRVEWNGVCSLIIFSSNWVKQDGIVSHV